MLNLGGLHEILMVLFVAYTCISINSINTTSTREGQATTMKLQHYKRVR